MLKQYSLKLPYAVHGGDDAMEQITNILKTSGAKKVIIFTDKGVEKTGLFTLPEAMVKASDIGYYVLNELPTEPSYEVMQKLIDEFKRSSVSFIVVCGGGSVMDAAKLAGVLVTDDYDVKGLLGTPGMAKRHAPVILIPTIAGTGAEITLNATVAAPERELKVGIVNENMIADYTILDARMVRDLPRPIAATTGVDALAHCIGCFTGNRANPFGDIYAFGGLDLILSNIGKTYDDPKAMGEESRMQIATYYDGLAITASGTTAVHALGYPLGGKYHIAYGVPNAILLALVMRFNSEDPEAKKCFTLTYDRCCHGEKNCETVEERYAWMVRRIEEVVGHLDVPKGLKSFDIPEEDLESLMQTGIQVQRLLTNNRRLITEADARAPYLEIM